MQSHRFNKIVSSQTKIAMRVFHAVSTVEFQPAKRIYQELMDSPNPVRNLQMVEGCLNSLVKSKLLIEKPRGMFIRVIPTNEKLPDKVVENLSYSIKKSLIKTSRPPRFRPNTKLPSDTWNFDTTGDATDVPTPTITPKIETVVPDIVAVDVPEGHYSQYLLPKHDILINYPNSGGVQNYKIMLATQSGDVVRFARPEGLSFSNWRGRITTMRHYYYNRYGVMIEAHFYHNYVDLQVMQLQEPTNVINVTERTPSVAEEIAFPSRPFGKTVVRVDSENSSLPVPEILVVPKEPISVEVSTSVIVNDPDAYLENEAILVKPVMEIPETVVEPVVLCDNEFERNFWHQVFILKVGQATSVIDAGEYADCALALHRKRFK